MKGTGGNREGTKDPDHLFMGEAAHPQVSQVGPRSIYTRGIWRDGLFGWGTQLLTLRGQAPVVAFQKVWGSDLSSATHQATPTQCNKAWLCQLLAGHRTTFPPGFVIKWDDTCISTVHATSDSRSGVPNSLRPHGLYSPWNSPGQNTGVDSLSLLQGIFPTQGSNLGLPHCRQILYQLSHREALYTTSHCSNTVISGI